MVYRLILTRQNNAGHFENDRYLTWNIYRVARREKRRKNDRCATREIIGLQDSALSQNYQSQVYFKKSLKEFVFKNI
jgi:hypothetical protein